MEKEAYENTRDKIADSIAGVDGENLARLDDGFWMFEAEKYRKYADAVMKFLPGLAGVPEIPTDVKEAAKEWRNSLGPNSPWVPHATLRRDLAKILDWVLGTLPDPRIEAVADTLEKYSYGDVERRPGKINMAKVILAALDALEKP